MPGFKKQVSKQALQAYLQFGYVPQPLAIFEGCFKLPPASYISINLETFNFSHCTRFEHLAKLEALRYKTWWAYNTKAKKHNALSLSEAKQELNTRLTGAVGLQLLSDVPVGCFLSGGIDSSLIASMIAKHNKPLTCFNIGFEFADYDESKDAKKIASHLGLNFESSVCSLQDALKLIPKLSEAYTEPFADSSQIPTMLISSLARQHVTVVLTGDCGDELFGGYNRYVLAEKYAKWLLLIPQSIKRFIVKQGLEKHKNTLLPLFQYIFGGMLSGNLSQRYDKMLQKLSQIESGKSFYQSLITEWRPEHNLMPGFEQQDTFFEAAFMQRHLSLPEQMMLADISMYMTDDILCKVDRAAMYSSLETRVPFLDRDVLDFAATLNKNCKLKGGQSKRILKELLADFVPVSLFDRPKQGFGVPVSEWMRTHLKDWLCDSLSKGTNDLHGLFNQNVIDTVLNEHISGQQNHEHKLWFLLQFNQWYCNQVISKDTILK